MKKFEEFGIAAVLPGLVHAAELLQQQIDSLRERISEVPQRERISEEKHRKKPKATWWTQATKAERAARIISMNKARARNRLKTAAKGAA
jgi:hypothetical protein